jgi:hypothetical protein
VEHPVRTPEADARGEVEALLDCKVRLVPVTGDERLPGQDHEGRQSSSLCGCVLLPGVANERPQRLPQQLSPIDQEGDHAQPLGRDRVRVDDELPCGLLQLQQVRSTDPDRIGADLEPEPQEGRDTGAQPTDESRQRLPVVTVLEHVAKRQQSMERLDDLGVTCVQVAALVKGPSQQREARGQVTVVVEQQQSCGHGGVAGPASEPEPRSTSLSRSAARAARGSTPR